MHLREALYSVSVTKAEQNSADGFGWRHAAIRKWRRRQSELYVAGVCGLALFSFFFFFQVSCTHTAAGSAGGVVTGLLAANATEVNAAASLQPSVSAPSPALSSMRSGGAAKSQLLSRLTGLNHPAIAPH